MKNRILTFVMLTLPAWTFQRSADAFTVFDILQHGIARWNSAPHLVDGSERSLDGGLRYSLQGGSYETFRDLLQWAGTPPSVADFQAAVQGAFANWEAVDPATLLGTDVRFVADLETEVVSVPFVPDLADRFQLNPGAEIDLVVDSTIAGAGLANPYLDPNTAAVTLTSGVSDYPAAVISGVDIYINGQVGWDLTNFHIVLTHEIGHALGLGDVDVGKGAYDAYTDYYDDNFDGTSRETVRATLTNSFADLVDPLDPDNSPGLMIYDICNAIDGDPFKCRSHPGVRTPGVNLLMESFSRLPLDTPQPLLQNDEFAGRQFLYPVLPVPETSSSLLLACALANLFVGNRSMRRARRSH